MKIGGVEVSKQWTSEPLVFRHGKDLVAFIAQPVDSWDEFEALVPAPDPKKYGGRFVKGGGFQGDPEHPAYKEALDERLRLMDAYTFIKSLEPSQIEWKQVRLDDPTTWKHYRTELRQAITSHELNLVIKLVVDTNALDARALEANRESFFLQTSASAEPPTGPAAEVASSAL